MAVGVGLRISQLSRNSILEFFRYEVLQAFGFCVNFVPGVVEHVVQKALKQPVMAENFDGARIARRRKPNSAMLFVLDSPEQRNGFAAQCAH